jgi:hypothetical protein
MIYSLHSFFLYVNGMYEKVFCLWTYISRDSDGCTRLQASWLREIYFGAHSAIWTYMYIRRSSLRSTSINYKLNHSMQLTSWSRFLFEDIVVYPKVKIFLAVYGDYCLTILWVRQLQPPPLLLPSLQAVSKNSYKSNILWDTVQRILITSNRIFLAGLHIRKVSHPSGMWDICNKVYIWRGKYYVCEVQLFIFSCVILLLCISYVNPMICQLKGLFKIDHCAS